MQSLSRARAQGGISTSEAVNAPQFQRLLDRLEGGARCVILDLGSARAESIALFSQFRCRLDIADVADRLDELNAEEDARCLEDRAEAVLPAIGPEPTDIVLCWDLPNYLSRPALAALMARIAARGKPGTLTHMLVVYSTPRMSARPGRFVPLADHRLVNLAPSCEDRAAPRYTPEDLMLCMPQYAVDHASLLRNGMQEFLLRL